MKKKTHEELISDDLDDMLKKNPEIENDPLYRLGGVLDDMTDYLQIIKSEEKKLEPKDPNLDEILQHGPLKVAVKKIEQYYKELKDIALKIAKIKNH
tara:strand:- start:184 stop:474 length:291 start_codon:yes stop_codon:yes gene_type:complete